MGCLVAQLQGEPCAGCVAARLLAGVALRSRPPPPPARFCGCSCGPALINLPHAAVLTEVNIVRCDRASGGVTKTAFRRRYRSA